MKNRGTVIVTACAAVLCLLVGLGAAKPDQAHQKGLSVIKWSSVYDYNRTLASDRFGGRYDADPAFMEMARWAAGKYREWGLKPLNAKEGYFQSYAFPYTVVDQAEVTVYVPEKKAEPSGAKNRRQMFGPPPAPAGPPVLIEKKLEPVTDFLPFTSSGTGTVEKAEIVFVGYGLSAPELGYDDYAGVDVKGKFVLCFSGSPEPRDKFEAVRDKVVKTAAAKGALGIIRIGAPLGNPGGGNWVEGFQSVMISNEVVDQMLSEKGLTSENLLGDLQLYQKPLSFPLSSKISCKTVSRHFPDGKSCNIIGWIEGSDPKLREEVVIYGAHVDHIGRHMGLLFPGADDNASGSAVVMQIAEAFAKMGRRPKRSVAFALLSGEEYGLLGAQQLARNLPPQFKKVDVMINFDMVGEGDGAAAVCSPFPAELKKCIEQAGSSTGVLNQPVRENQPKRMGGTDHTAFAVILNCPTAAFFSNGPHLHYHLPGDKIYRINPDIMADIARVAYLSGALFADR